MKLFIFTHAFLPIYGGLEKFLHELAKELIADGYEIELCTWHQHKDAPAEEMLDGIQVRRFSCLSSVLKHIKSLRGTRRFDLALVAEPFGKHVPISRAIRRHLKVPLLLNLLGTASETAPWWTKALCNCFATEIVACSDYCSSQFALGAQKTSVIYHGIPAETIGKSIREKGERLKALTTCRIVRRKDLATLVRAAALTPTVDYRIVGDTALDPEYTRELQDLGKSLGAQNLYFTGKISDAELNNEYAEADLFVLPTQHEMFGIVFIEAMAAGLPVVSTNVTAVPEVVSPDTGYLVPPGDAKELAACISRFEDPAVHRKFAMAALQRAATFSFENTVKAYKEVFLRLVNTSQTTS